MTNYVLGISGSPRKDGNTDITVKKTLEEIRACKHVVIDFLRVADFNIKHCQGCRECMTLGRCAIEDDQFNQVMDKVLKADVLIIGVPVYWNSPPGVMKDFIDRTHGFYASEGGRLFRGKKVGIISPATSSGFASHEDAIQSWLRYYGATVVDKIRVYACEKGEVLNRPTELQKVQKLATVLCSQM